MRLNPNIRTFLAKHELTQRDIAAALDTTEETVSRWINGHMGVSARRLFDLTLYLQQYDATVTMNDVVVAD